SVHHSGEPAKQRVILVVREQRIPLGSPNDLDDVPPGSREKRFELVDELPVSTYGPVKPLQIAVDHESQIVETFPRCQRERRGARVLIHFTVAKDAPYVT